MDTSVVNMILLTLGVMAVAIFTVTLLINFTSSKTLLLESTEHVVETTSKFATVEYQPYDDVELRGSDARYIVEKYGNAETGIDIPAGQFFVRVSHKGTRAYESGSYWCQLTHTSGGYCIEKRTDTSNNDLIEDGGDLFLPATYIDAQARYHSYLLVSSSTSAPDSIKLNGTIYYLPTGYKIGSCADPLEEIHGIWLVEY